jgi:hypothetical protein
LYTYFSFQKIFGRADSALLNTDNTIFNIADLNSKNRYNYLIGFFVETSMFSIGVVKITLTKMRDGYSIPSNTRYVPENNQEYTYRSYRYPIVE